jgi:hypothetical protein
VPLRAIPYLLLSAGVLSALLALNAVFDQSWEVVYAWLGMALLTLACFDNLEPADGEEDPVSVERAAASVAFLTCTFVPVAALVHAGFLDGIGGVVVAGLVLLSALYRTTFLEAGRSPTFQGFPAAWGIIGFYLHAFDATPAAAFLVAGLGIVACLLPVSAPHPFRSPRWPAFTRLVAGGWLIAAAVTLLQGFPAAPAIKTGLLAVALYGLVLTILLSRPSNAPVTGSDRPSSQDRGA